MPGSPWAGVAPAHGPPLGLLVPREASPAAPCGRHSRLKFARWAHSTTTDIRQQTTMYGSGWLSTTAVTGNTMVEAIEATETMRDGQAAG